jgi:hypothetical protein
MRPKTDPMGHHAKIAQNFLSIVSDLFATKKFRDSLRYESIIAKRISLNQNKHLAKIAWGTFGSLWGEACADSILCSLIFRCTAQFC